MMSSRDHGSRRERLVWGTQLVAGLGSQLERKAPAGVGSSEWLGVTYSSMILSQLVLWRSPRQVLQ